MHAVIYCLPHSHSQPWPALSIEVRTTQPPARSTIDGDRNRYGAERPWTAEPIAAVSRIRRAADDDANDEEALAATCDNGIELIKDRVTSSTGRTWSA